MWVLEVYKIALVQNVRLVVGTALIVLEVFKITLVQNLHVHFGTFGEVWRYIKLTSTKQGTFFAHSSVLEVYKITLVQNNNSSLSYLASFGSV